MSQSVDNLILSLPSYSKKNNASFDRYNKTVIFPIIEKFRNRKNRTKKETSNFLNRILNIQVEKRKILS